MCVAEDVSPIYLQITGFSDEVLMHFFNLGLSILLEISWTSVELREKKDFAISIKEISFEHNNVISHF